MNKTSSSNNNNKKSSSSNNNSNNNSKPNPIAYKNEMKNKYIVGTQDKSIFFDNVVQPFRCKNDIIYEFLFGENDFRFECLHGLSKMIKDKYGRLDSEFKMNTVHFSFFDDISQKDYPYRSVQDVTFIMAMWIEPAISEWIIKQNRLNNPAMFVIWRDTYISKIMHNYISCTFSYDVRLSDIADRLKCEYLATCGLAEPPKSEYNKEYDIIKANGNRVTPIPSTTNRLLLLSSSSSLPSSSSSSASSSAASVASASSSRIVSTLKQEEDDFYNSLEK